MKKQRNLILFLLVFAMTICLFGNLSLNVEAATPAAKTGYHLVYHNNHSWSAWGAHIDNCDNYHADSTTRQCYHYLKMDIITKHLYADGGGGGASTVKSLTLPTSDGGTWTVSGENMYAHFENGNLVTTSTPTSSDIFSAKKDIRVYYFVSSLPDCDNGLNNKYVKNMAYYKWLGSNGTPYGLDNVVYQGAWGGRAYDANYQGSRYYHYFYGYNNLAGEGLNHNNLYPTFDCAINNTISNAFSHYDANGNAVFAQKADGFVWNRHTHTAYRYICDGHLVPNTYTVVFNGNGATSGSTAQKGFTYDVAGNLTANGFSKSNSTFLGWATTPNGPVRYTNSQSVINLTATNGGVVNLYAVWQSNTFPVTVVDIDSETGEELGRTTVDGTYGSTISGSILGTNTDENHYYPGYGYTNSTSTVVTGTNDVVYRYFDTEKIDIKGAVNWNDNSNFYDSRPDSSTVRVYQDGVEIWNSTLPATENSIPYSIDDLPKYSKVDGHEFIYSASQDTVVSKNEDDQYTTTQSGFIFNNNLDNGGTFFVSGSVTWVDNQNATGTRPDETVINLYQNGVLIDTQTLEAIDTGYSFINLEKFDENLNPYIYTAEEVFSSKLLDLNTGEWVDAYSVSVNGLDFTNTLIDRLYVKPNSVNNLFVELEFTDCNWGYIQLSPEDIVLACELKRVESYLQNGNIVYGTNYDGLEYNTLVTDLGNTITSIPAGKYEICLEDSRFDINDITLNSETGVSLVEEDGKVFVVIEERKEPCSGNVVIDLTHKIPIGYESNVHAQNYFKTNASGAAGTSVFSVMSDSVQPELSQYTISYFDEKELISTESFAEGSSLNIMSYNVEGFMGWATEEDGDVVYVEGDTILLTQNMALYSVVEELEEILETKEPVLETTELETEEIMDVEDIVDTNKTDELMEETEESVEESESIYEETESNEEEVEETTESETMEEILETEEMIVLETESEQN